MEPPTAEQLERYRQDGTLAARADAARSFGNHRMAPALAARLGSQTALKALPDAPTVLPSDGSPRVLTLLIAFSDMPGFTDPTVVDDRIFGDGETTAYPYESLTNFYRRSSYGQLEITGSTLGWYTTAYPRSEVVESYRGRQALIKEAFTHYDTEGHDFSQYDNDGDGVIDYLVHRLDRGARRVGRVLVGLSDQLLQRQLHGRRRSDRHLLLAVGELHLAGRVLARGRHPRDRPRPRAARLLRLRRRHRPQGRVRRPRPDGQQLGRPQRLLEVGARLADTRDLQPGQPRARDGAVRRHPARRRC